MLDPRLAQMTEEHLAELTDTIWEGRCVAFVGAGFSAAAGLPGWAQLLEQVLARVPAESEDREVVETLLDRPSPSSRELEAAAQLLEDALGRDRFRDAVTASLADPTPSSAFRARRANLLQTPFRAVLTTNFDPLLPGIVPGPDAYRTLLRKGWSGPWDECHWPAVQPGVRETGPPVLQLHGQVGGEHLVFAQRDYRELLYGNTAYLTFLKALFATRTVLFLGFSFRDAYLNLLRAELLQLVERVDGDQAPLAYAVLPGISWAEAVYLRRHEGLGVLSYDASDGDHSGFDVLLERIVEASNPIRRLRRRLETARVLWLDPRHERNRVARELLGATYVEAASLEEARHKLTEATWDLVITHFGWCADGPSTAEQLLDWVHQQRVRAPVIVFSSPDMGAVNRPTALGCGAADLVWAWPELFKAVQRVLPDARSEA